MSLNINNTTKPTVPESPALLASPSQSSSVVLRPSASESDFAKIAKYWEFKEPACVADLVSLPDETAYIKRAAQDSAPGLTSPQIDAFVRDELEKLGISLIKEGSTQDSALRQPIAKKD